MYWDNNTEMNTSFEATMSSSPINHHQDVSIYESESPPRYDTSPMRSTYTVRRQFTFDQSTQDSGYSPSETSRPSPRRQFSFSSSIIDEEESFDLLEMDENDMQPAAEQKLPTNFERLITDTISQRLSQPTQCSKPSGRPLLRRPFSVIGNGAEHIRAKSCLFEKKDNKRIECDDIEMKSPTPKRSRLLDRSTPIRRIGARPVLTRSVSNQETITRALQRSSTDPDLVGDFTKSFSLPLVAGKHPDLKSISPSTLAALIDGAYDDKVASYKIIDCRFPYEYDGGHIMGALNIYTKQKIMALLETADEDSKLEQDENKRHILIFHCEFSSERAPNLSRFLRDSDRNQNKDYYPFLHFPEVYLIDGGYKNVFESHIDLCTPRSYRAMLHPEFEESMRHYRLESKTFNTDMKGSKSRKTSMRF